MTEPLKPTSVIPTADRGRNGHAAPPALPDAAMPAETYPGRRHQSAVAAMLGAGLYEVFRDVLDDDLIVSMMAETNATGFGLESADVLSIQPSGAGWVVEFSFTLTGDHNPDRAYCGSRIEGTALLVVRPGAHTLTVTGAENDFDTAGGEEPDPDDDDPDDDEGDEDDDDDDGNDDDDDDGAAPLGTPASLTARLGRPPRDAWMRLHPGRSEPVVLLEYKPSNYGPPDYYGVAPGLCQAVRSSMKALRAHLVTVPGAGTAHIWLVPESKWSLYRQAVEGILGRGDAFVSSHLFRIHPPGGTYEPCPVWSMPATAGDLAVSVPGRPVKELLHEALAANQALIDDPTHPVYRALTAGTRL
jgi:hypothetical protein